jgi:hypothetical protein
MQKALLTTLIALLALSPFALADVIVGPQLSASGFIFYGIAALILFAANCIALANILFKKFINHQTDSKLSKLSILFAVIKFAIAFIILSFAAFFDTFGFLGLPILSIIVSIAIHSLNLLNYQNDKKNTNNPISKMNIAPTVISIICLIVMILMLVTSTVPHGGGAYSAKASIENGIASALPSSMVTIRECILATKDAITSDELTNKTGLEASRIYFVYGELKSTDVLIKNTLNFGGTLTNIHASPIRLKAKVICKATGEQAETALAKLSESGTYNVSDFNSIYCAEDTQSCCVIVLEKPSN